MRYFTRPTFRRTANMQQTVLKTKKLLLGTLLVASALAFGSVSHAQQDDDTSGPFFGNKAPGKWTIGLKAARIDPNIEDISDADALGIVLGYEFATSIGRLRGTSSVELEYLQSDTTQFFTGSGTNYDAEALGLYYTYRTAGRLYFKAKGGLTVNTLEIDSVIPSQNFNLESTNLALGIGIGVRIGDRAQFEIDYLQEAGTNDLMAPSDNIIIGADQEGGTDLGILSLTGLVKF